MIYGSVCSGIEAASIAWEPLGFSPAWFSEIEKFPSAILKERWPDVPNLGDMKKILSQKRYRHHGSIDILVGGTPCQSFSIAGLRKGLADSRGNLALTFLGLVDAIRPRWVVWENVPGVLSAHSHDSPDPSPPNIDLDGDEGPEDGEENVVVDEYSAREDHAFACFLAGLSKLGYGCSYGVLDAQHAGVPQRRRRVFVVGHLGEWQPAAAVLFDRTSLSGDSAPSRKKRTGIARALTSSTGGVSGKEQQTTFVGEEGPLNELKDGEEDGPIGFSAKDDGGDAVEDGVPTLRAGNHDTSHANSGNWPAVAYEDGSQAVPIQDSGRGRRKQNGDGIGSPGDPMFSLDTKGSHGVAVPETPKLLTMREGKDGGGKGPLVRDDKSGALSTGNGQVLFNPTVFDPNQITNKDNRSNPTPEQSHTLPANAQPPVLFDGPEEEIPRPPIAFQPHPDSTEHIDKSPTVLSKSAQQPCIIEGEEVKQFQWASGGGQLENDTAQSLRAGAEHNYQFLRSGMAVRRLTPIECERLQGLPDNHTKIPWRGKPADKCPDGPRYKAIGNSMAVPVMALIGRRLQEVDDIIRSVPK